MQAPYLKQEELPVRGHQPLYAFLVTSQVVECLTPHYPIYYVSGSFYLSDTVTNRLFLDWVALGDSQLSRYLPLSSTRYICKCITDLDPGEDAVVLVICATNFDAHLQEQWERHSRLDTWKEYDFMGLVSDPTQGHKLVWGPHTVEAQAFSQLLIASVMWKRLGDNSPRQSMLTGSPAYRIKVTGEQVWAPRLSGTFGRVVHLALTLYGDFVNEIPIAETTVLTRCIDGLFTNENAVALGLSTPKLQRLRSLQPCLFLYVSDEIMLNEDNWKACTGKYRQRHGWSKDLGLFEVDFNAIAIAAKDYASGTV